MKTNIWTILLALVCAYTVSIARTEVVFELLGPTASYAVYPHYWVSGVSADGSVITGWHRTGEDRYSETSASFIWRDGELSYDTPDGAEYPYTDVSADGSVLVGNILAPSGLREAYRMENGILEGLGHLPGTLESRASGVSSDGLIVVGYCSGEFGDRAFIWQDGIMTALGDIPGGNRQTKSHAVSADGSVVVGTRFNDYPDSEVVVWENGVARSLGIPGGMYYQLSISDDGSVIVGNTLSSLDGTGTARAFILEDGVLSILDRPDSNEVSGALSVSADGTVVTGFNGWGWPGGHAVIWTKENDWKGEFLDDLLDDAGIDRQGFVLLNPITRSGRAFAGHGMGHSGHQAYRLLLEEKWSSYSVENDFVATDGFMGPLMVKEAPWIWCLDNGCWFHIPEEVADSGSGWIYCPDASQIEASMMGDSYGWVWCSSLEKIFYVPAQTVSTGQGWIYLL